MVLTVQVSKHPSTFVSLLPLPNLHLITNNNVCDEETRGEQWTYSPPYEEFRQFFVDASLEKGSCLKPFFSTAVAFKSTFSKSIMSKLGLLYYKDSIVKDFTVLLMLSFWGISTKKVGKPATELSFLFVLQNVQVVKIVLVMVMENVRYVS